MTDNASDASFDAAERFTDNESPTKPRALGRTRRQRRQDRRMDRLVAVRDLHAELSSKERQHSARPVRPPRGVGRQARSVWQTLEAQRVREELGDSRWIRNPPRWLGARGRREFLQAERAAVKAKMRRDIAAGGLYTAEEQQRGALVLAVLLALIPLTYLVLTSCGA